MYWMDCWKEKLVKTLSYQIYMTNPTTATQSENPIQYGTCRMILDGDNSRISGKYWTSSNTTGDIEWVAEQSQG